MKLTALYIDHAHEYENKNENRARVYIMYVGNCREDVVGKADLKTPRVTDLKTSDKTN